MKTAMRLKQNIIERLQDAANIMHEHAQYNDEESYHNGEGLAAETCEDAADLIAELLPVLEAAISRVQLANEEGNPILSAWLPDALSTLRKAKGEV